VSRSSSAVIEIAKEEGRRGACGRDTIVTGFMEALFGESMEKGIIMGKVVWLIYQSEDPDET
jgi:hypothetical protein